jgi:hypothetical protein
MKPVYKTLNQTQKVQCNDSNDSNNLNDSNDSNNLNDSNDSNNLNESNDSKQLKDLVMLSNPNPVSLISH